MPLKAIDLQQEALPLFPMFSKDWFLITAGSPNDCSAMTAAWGGMGVMWGKNVFTAVIRPTRCTYDYVERESIFTVSFLTPTEENRKRLSLCGSRSGRDYPSPSDKIKDAGLTVVSLEGGVTFEEAGLVFVCKKLYQNDVQKECFLDSSLLSHYKESDFHRAYTAEILSAYRRCD